MSLKTQQVILFHFCAAKFNDTMTTILKSFKFDYGEDACNSGNVIKVQR